MQLSIQYYDLVLLGILGSLVLGAGVGYGTALSTAITVPAASVIGITLMYHAIFLKGPVNTARELSDEAHEIEFIE